MKKVIFPLLAISMMLIGCLENIQEVTINEDGSGNLKTTSNMDALIAMAKQMGEGDTDLSDKKIDTVISMDSGLESLEALTEDDKKLLAGGKLHMKSDMAADKFEMAMDFPFKSTKDIDKISSLSAKIIPALIKEKASEGNGGADTPAMPEMTGFDDYFITTYTNGVIEKKLNKSQYALAEKDEFLSGVRQTSAMGLVMKTTYVFNLPRPATKVEGKNVVLSEDKKKVTVVGDIDNFFDDPSMFEFKIEY